MAGMNARAAMLAAVLGLAAPAAALAHHGWSWTEDEETRLSGTIEEIRLGNPHAQISLRAEDGVWRGRASSRAWPT